MKKTDIFRKTKQCIMKCRVSVSLFKNSQQKNLTDSKNYPLIIIPVAKRRFFLCGWLSQHDL